MDIKAMNQKDTLAKVAKGNLTKKDALGFVLHMREENKTMSRKQVRLLTAQALSKMYKDSGKECSVVQASLRLSVSLKLYDRYNRLYQLNNLTSEARTDFMQKVSDSF